MVKLERVCLVLLIGCLAQYCVAITEDTIGTWLDVPGQYLNPNLTIKYKVWGGISIKFRVEKKGPGYVGIGIGGSTMAECDYVLIEKVSQMNLDTLTDFEHESII